MDLSGVDASLIKTQAESHLSLASINVDFSLFRVQPPVEYHEVGRLLSSQRKEEADVGKSHATAAKLGALFDGLVPPISHLIHAYGLRCSEIAKSPTFNPKGTEKYGLFASQVGADGTTIWAAATSGSSAIAVHLLACMLARIWDSPKAISIWMELIAVRKQTLASSGKLTDFHPSQITLNREQIANWDASARAWCLTADQANERRQKQLRLIIDHLGLPVSPKLDLSESVIDAWKTAMVTIDKIIAGEPQSVQIGAPLLGLASWHLYPDMIVFGKDKEVKDVKQKDRLIPSGGIMTLGIEDTRREGSGIYWSLPLAHLRYYGDPVLCEASLHSSTSRVSIDQLIYVALGSVIRRWLADADDIEPAAKLFVEINSFIGFGLDVNTNPAWMSLLASKAKAFLESTGDRRREILQLIKCGRRRYPQFVDNPGTHSVFGLSDCTTFLRLLPSNRARVSLLREVAKDFSDSNHLMVIQCEVGTTQPGFELFSVDKLKDKDTTSSNYVRWTNWELKDSSHDDAQAPKLIRLNQRIPGLRSPTEYHWDNVPKDFFAHFLQGKYLNSQWLQARGASIRTRFLFGEQNVAALYSIRITTWDISPNMDPHIFEHNRLRLLPNVFVIRHIAEALDMELPDPTRLCYHLASSNFSKDENDRQSSRSLAISMKALLTVWILYRSLPDATVELKAAGRPLCGHQWIPAELSIIDSSGPYHLTQEQTFACVAMFESGNFNFQPSAMNGVLAISSGNSLYVARCLLQDPCQSPSFTMIDRVVGTVGKSGMALLIHPQLPRMRPATHDYALVNHHAFDGNSEDCFWYTTLHMSFTEWTLPIDVGSRGNRDIEAYYVETAIGVYDKGKWVADVNVLDVFRHRLSRILPKCLIRHHVPLAPEGLGKLVAIDNWDELIDSPPEVAVVRAHKNWQARLATAALSLQRGHETRVLPDEVCWTCCTELPSLLSTTGDQDKEFHIDQDNDVIGVPSTPVNEENSDSEIDEVLADGLIRSKKRKLSEGHKEEECIPELQQLNLNIVYIL